ncbi:penicillin acylase family protein [Spongiactinospora rosea]|uniref:Penicillin acylase family protein n=1 Tax=Spongiactinospora rosea TaxID=2248750 RepID=A0A366M3S6_9ACTN|nr:penicillin acylase family protein [Spongiactinospora rosea]RBQ20841.1 penicillin acylase family protein [Spongiactinospora rosea]
MKYSRPLLAAGISLAGLLASAVVPAAPASAADTRAVPGLRAPVQQITDRWGVPHLYARSTDDLFFAQGYTAAKDRLFQMDLWRRRGLGLLSEVLGPAYLAQDRATRLFLYRGDMREEWDSYGPEARRAATRFTEGVNAYIDALDPAALPPEFGKLGYTPARWRPEDVVRIRSNALSLNVASEVIRSMVVCAGGIEAAGRLGRHQPEWTTTLPDGLDPCAVTPDILTPYMLAITGVTVQNGQVRTVPPQAPAAEGSNAWAVAPHRTATGRPVLAADPHRAMTAPALRYVTHLSAPGLNVIGAGEPALPGVAMGHNGTVAFGLTVFGVDQEDLYVYRLDPDDPGRYRYGDRWERFTTVKETVPVAGQAPREVELTFTRHGPVMKVDTARGLAYAVRTTWLEPGTSPYFGSLRLMRARDFRDFAEIMRTWGGPPENQVYADTSGTIGWVPGGLAPLRTGYDGLLPVPGDGRFEWRGFLDGARLPRVSDPRAGFISSANEFNLPPTPRVGFEWEAPYRKQRIDQVLAADRRHSVADAMRLQGDQVSLPARRVLAVLRRLTGDDPVTRRALALLRRYDGTASAGSAGAALFEPWFTRHLTPAFLAKVLPPHIAAILPRSDVTLLIEAVEHPTRWFGPDGAKVRDAMLLDTLKAAYAEVSGRLGDDPATWRWGALHHTVFAGPLGAHLGPFPRGGSPYTVDASQYQPGTYTSHTGAALKMVLDVGDWDASRFTSAPGQSGDPRSPHYDDLIEGYAPLLYTRAAVERNAESRLTLIPARE